MVRRRGRLWAVAVGAVVAALVGAGVVVLNGVGHASEAVPWQQVDAGEKHTCGIYHESLWCWGDNTYGQLGLGDTTDRYFPHRVMGNTANWIKVSAGGHRTCALNADENIYCWGLNPTAAYTGYESLPKKVNGTGWTDLATGSRHTCAIFAGTFKDPTGLLYCWGANQFGELGLGHNNQQPKPTIVSQNNDWHGISVGASATCALRGTDLYCWGYNLYGHLGTGDRTSRNKPTRVDAGIIYASTGGASCAISTGERLYCWGNDVHGAAGLPDASGYVTEAMLVPSASWDWAMVDTGQAHWHACGVRTNGRGYCWGTNSSGQPGTGDYTNRDRPTEIYPDGTYRWKAVTSGLTHTCGIRDDDVMMCWGSSQDGALGLGSTTKINYPKESLLA